VSSISLSNPCRGTDTSCIAREGITGTVPSATPTRPRLSRRRGAASMTGCRSAEPHVSACSVIASRHRRGRPRCGACVRSAPPGARAPCRPGCGGRVANARGLRCVGDGRDIPVPVVESPVPRVLSPGHPAGRRGTSRSRSCRPTATTTWSSVVSFMTRTSTGMRSRRASPTADAEANRSSGCFSRSRRTTSRCRPTCPARPPG